MAITDEQLDTLIVDAARIASTDDIVVSGSNYDIASAVIDAAADDGMVTLDEFGAPVTIDDLPATEDHAAIADSARHAAARTEQGISRLRDELRELEGEGQFRDIPDGHVAALSDQQVVERVCELYANDTSSIL